MTMASLVRVTRGRMLRLDTELKLSSVTIAKMKIEKHFRLFVILL